MGDVGEGISSPFAIILSLEFITGILANGFIALVNCMDWAKGRKISSVDQILTALAISRIALLCSVFIDVSASAFYPHLLMTEAMNDSAYTVASHFNLWLTTCLSIFYFLKIAVFSNSTFLFLKRRVEKVVSMILLASLVLLLIQLILMNLIRIGVWDDGSQRNSSYSFKWTSSQFRKPLLMFCFTLNFIPFMVSMPAFLLLIFSLWKHLKKTQPSDRDVSTSAHVKNALTTGFAFLLLGAVFFISLLAQVSSLPLLDGQVTVLFGQFIGMTFPSCHSWILVFGNSKLRQAFLSAVSWLRCRDKDAELTGP